MAAKDITRSKSLSRKAPCRYATALPVSEGLCLRDGPGRVHEAYVTECLREVSQQFVRLRVYLLGKQPDIIHIGNRLLEGRSGSLNLSGQRECVSQPERAEQEGSLLSDESIGGAVTVDQAVSIGQSICYRINGRSHTWVGTRDNSAKEYIL